MTYISKKTYPGKNANNYYVETRDDKELREIQKMRVELGMPVLEVIERNCLRCNKKFETFRSSANFSCRVCKRSKDNLDENFNF